MYSACWMCHGKTPSSESTYILPTGKAAILWFKKRLWPKFQSLGISGGTFVFTASDFSCIWLETCYRVSEIQCKLWAVGVTSGGDKLRGFLQPKPSLFALRWMGEQTSHMGPLHPPEPLVVVHQQEICHFGVAALQPQNDRCIAGWCCCWLCNFVVRVWSVKVNIIGNE